MNNNPLSFPNGFEKTEVRWEKIKIKLAHNVLQPYAVGAFNHCTNLEAQNYE